LAGCNDFVISEGIDNRIDKVYHADMPKYDSLRKNPRNQLILKYHQDHPELSLKEIGQVFGGISRQRISRIIKQEEERMRSDQD
jgi:DNA-directed RNA polymerase specialized sigma subunit